MSETAKPSRFHIRIWHLFVLIAIGAWFAPSISIFGNCRAHLEIVEMQVTHDPQWGKSWAALECRFLEPKMLMKEPVRAFINVDKDFQFSDKYKVGDKLQFRYQYKDFGSWETEDPILIVLTGFFGLNAIPSKFDDGLYILGQQVEAD